jgi:hypothetical protein
VSASYYYVEERIDEALEAFSNGEYASLAAAARAFNLTPRQVQRRHKGGDSRSTRPSTNRRLTADQEVALCAYIENAGRMGLSPTIAQVEKSANFLLRKAHNDPSTPPPLVGQHWMKRFQRRHPEIFKRKQRPLAVERQHVQDPQTIQQHFYDFRNVVQKRGICSDDTWNMDETGFRVGCRRGHYILTFEPKMPQVLPDPDKRDHITITECISGGGRVIDPMVIFKGTNILNKYALENDLTNGTLFATSDTGYINDELAIEWLKHFDQQTKMTRLGDWRLLIIDGFGSHMTEEFFNYTQHAKIELLRLPAHSTHITQPLDVGCF